MGYFEGMIEGNRAALETVDRTQRLSAFLREQERAEADWQTGLPIKQLEARVKTNTLAFALDNLDESNAISLSLKRLGLSEARAKTANEIMNIGLQRDQLAETNKRADAALTQARAAEIRATASQLMNERMLLDNQRRHDETQRRLGQGDRRLDIMEGRPVTQMTESGLLAMYPDGRFTLNGQPFDPNSFDRPPELGPVPPQPQRPGVGAQPQQAMPPQAAMQQAPVNVPGVAGAVPNEALPQAMGQFQGQPTPMVTGIPPGEVPAARAAGIGIGLGAQQPAAAPVAAPAAAPAPAPQPAVAPGAGGQPLPPMPDLGRVRKPVPPVAISGYVANQDTLDNFKDALAEIRKNPDSTGWKGFLVKAGDVGRKVLDEWVDPEGVATRGAVGIGSNVVIHDLSGGAVTAPEMERMGIALPTVTDSAAVVERKLSKVIPWLEGKQNQYLVQYGPGSDYRGLRVQPATKAMVERAKVLVRGGERVEDVLRHAAAKGILIRRRDLESK